MVEVRRLVQSISCMRFWLLWVTLNSQPNIVRLCEIFISLSFFTKKTPSQDSQGPFGELIPVTTWAWTWTYPEAALPWTPDLPSPNPQPNPHNQTPPLFFYFYFYSLKSHFFEIPKKKVQVKRSMTDRTELKPTGFIAIFLTSFKLPWTPCFELHQNSKVQFFPQPTHIPPRTRARLR